MPMLLLTVVLTACTGSGETGPAAQPAGQPQTATTTVLEAGAVALQRDAPPDALDIYLIGFHPIRNNPRHQTEAHHFCRQVNADFAQCALFDGNTADANPTGIEYIISEEFATLRRPRNNIGIRTTARSSPANWWRRACRKWRRRN